MVGQSRNNKTSTKKGISKKRKILFSDTFGKWPNRLAEEEIIFDPQPLPTARKEFPQTLSPLHTQSEHSVVAMAPSCMAASTPPCPAATLAERLPAAQLGPQLPRHHEAVPGGHHEQHLLDGLVDPRHARPTESLMRTLGGRPIDDFVGGPQGGVGPNRCLPPPRAGTHSWRSSKFQGNSKLTPNGPPSPPPKGGTTAGYRIRGRFAGFL